MNSRFCVLFFCAVFCSLTLTSQTGPAGVGTSTNNVLWLKANAGTSTTTDGAAISSWNDQSGNGINVSQSTAVQRPLYEATLMNGMPAIEFDNSSVAGQNDYLTAPDNAILDNTAGYTFFTVSRIKAFDGNAKSIISKRTTIDVDEAFMLFYYTTNYFYADIDGLGNRFSTTPTTFSANTNYIIDVVYDGSLAAANRSKIYEGENLRKTATESSATIGDKPSALVIGATHSADNRPFNGYMSEIIMYRNTLNDAQRIIVNNYLSAKYDIALSTNNKYVGDDAANGDFDREVAGVGQESSGNNSSFAASAAAGFSITVNSGLDNGDYILAGHASVANAQITSDVGGMTGTLNARWQRIWYVDVTNTSTAINTNIEFDMSDGGVGTVVLGATSDYVLLYRAGLTGSWTELATANATPGDRVKFNGINLTTDGYYTVGTHDYPVSPLPMQLLNFNAIMNSGKVDITWSTASETNNDFFTVEKSKDGITFEPVITVDGAGNSTSIIDYADVDYSPYTGISYYRLKQTDFNGSFTYSAIVPVNYSVGDGGMTLFPNPATANEGFNLNISGLENQEVLVVVRDIAGRESFSKVILVTENNQLVAIDSEQTLAAGTYIVVASSNNKIYSQKLIVK
ncbi:MAG: T9SS type A sorting domain-containing protein [Bacteroidetes bacterium]|nr:T9SS type A sorting domain-containing protein [Bacteroidota bacterium]